MHTDISTQSGVALKDPKLFRQACYVDGAWVSRLQPDRGFRERIIRT
jgi:hypothetical protein